MYPNSSEVLFYRKRTIKPFLGIFAPIEKKPDFSGNRLNSSDSDLSNKECFGVKSWAEKNLTGEETREASIESLTKLGRLDRLQSNS